MDKLQKLLWNASRPLPRPLYAAIGWTLIGFGWFVVGLWQWAIIGPGVVALAVCLFYGALAVATLYYAEWHVRLLRLYFRLRPYKPLSRKPATDNIRPPRRSAPEAVILGTVFLIAGIGGLIGGVVDDRITGIFEHLAVFSASILLLVAGVYCILNRERSAPDHQEGKSR